MNSRLLTVFLLTIMTIPLSAQEGLPFREIEPYPESYAAENISARMIDALGFRFRWATDKLRETDLAFRPVEDSRSSRETIEHIYFLVQIIKNAHFEQMNEGADVSGKSVEELRREILQSLQEVRNFLVENDPDFTAMNIKFPQGSYPYWNIINGPLSDALYHTGQIVLLRRMSGNPMSPSVDVFQGIIRN